MRHCNNDVGFYIDQAYDYPAARPVVLFHPLPRKHTATLLLSLSFMASLQNDVCFLKNIGRRMFDTRRRQINDKVFFNELRAMLVVVLVSFY